MISQTRRTFLMILPRTARARHRWGTLILRDNWNSSSMV